MNLSVGKHQTWGEGFPVLLDSIILAMLERFLIFNLAPPPPGGPGGGSGLPFPKGIRGLGPIPARIREGNLFVICMLALSAAGS